MNHTNPLPSQQRNENGVAWSTFVLKADPDSSVESGLRAIALWRVGTWNVPIPNQVHSQHRRLVCRRVVDE